MSEWTRIPARELLRIQTTSKKIESVPVHKLDRPIAVTRGVTRATAYNKCSYDCTNSLYNFVIRHAPWALERAWPRARAPGGQSDVRKKWLRNISFRGMKKPSTHAVK